MNRNNTKLLLVTTVAALASAGAQAQGNASNGSRSALMQEVVITARKRAVGEFAQDTPIAMSAFSEEQFEAVFADDLRDLGRLAPNVELQQAGQVGVQNFTIRGMGVSGTTPSDSPAVGIFQNGVFWGSNYGSLLETFDIESVEILRGPQGTLFGRNVTGGAIVIRTKRPAEEFGLDVEGVYGTYGRRDFSIGVEGPIGDQLSGRLVVLDRSLDGYYDNNFTGEDFGESDNTLVRGTLVWEPAPSFDATLVLEDYEEDGDSQAAIGIERPGNFPYTQVGWRQPEDWWDIRLDNPGSAENEVRSAMLEVNWDLGHGIITSITGYRDTEILHNTDFDASEFSGFNRSIDMEHDQFSEELRYASTFSDTYTFIAGLYYFEQEQDYREGRDLAGVDEMGNIIEHATVVAAGSQLEQDSQAVFGEVDINLNPEWTLTLGGRYTQETIEGRTVPFGACPLDTSLPPQQRIRKLTLPCDLGPSEEEDWNDFSPKVGIRWQPNDVHMTYASATRGFRSGGFSMRGNPLLPPFDSEEVTAYEVGYKGDLFNQRLRLNAAIYHNKYDDLQRTILVPDGETGVAQSTGNAAQATVEGLELELTLQATENLVLNATYGLTDAQFEEFEGFNVDGDPLNTPDPELAEDLDFARVPDETYSASAIYDLSLGSAGDLSFRVAWQKIGSQYFDDRNNILEPSYELWDASVTYKDPTAHWKVSVFGKNLGNEEYAFWGSSLGALGENRFVGAPRTAGIRITYSY